MKPMLDGHIYELENGQMLVFVHRDRLGNMIFDKSTTTCEILDVLIHRIRSLNAEHPSEENIKTIAHLKMAQKHQKDRKQRQTQETAHVQKAHQ